MRALLPLGWSKSTALNWMASYEAPCSRLDPWKMFLSAFKTTFQPSFFPSLPCRSLQLRSLAHGAGLTIVNFKRHLPHLFPLLLTVCFKTHQNYLVFRAAHFVRQNRPKSAQNGALSTSLAVVHLIHFHQSIALKSRWFVVLRESLAFQPAVVVEDLFCRIVKSDANSYGCFALESFSARSSPLEASYFTQNRLETAAKAKTFQTQCRLADTLKAALMLRTVAFIPAHR